MIGAEIGHACRLQDDSGFKDHRSHRNRATMSSIGREALSQGRGSRFYVWEESLE